jgi:hypothetical protein
MLAMAAFTHAAAAQIPDEELIDEFAQCADWYQSPDQPGTTVVACDQAQLDRFIASGLTDPGPGGARIDGQDDHDRGVPTVYRSEDPRGLRSVRITGSGSQVGIYVATLGIDGVLRETTFPATTLPKGVPLEVRRERGSARVVTPSGQVLASAAITATRGERFPMLPRPHGLHARRDGERIVVSWLAAPRTDYKITSGTSRAGAGVHVHTYVTAGRPGRRRVELRLPQREDWVGLSAIRGSTTSRMVVARVA